MEVTTHSLEEFVAEARRFAAGLHLAVNGATVVCLSGELGAGKTTFTQIVAKELGITETVNSPTFVIMRRYKIPQNTEDRPLQFHSLVHIDAYRLSGDRDLEILGWRELIADPQSLMLIEWPEKVSEALPNTAIKIKFEHLSDSDRRIEIR